MEKFIWIEDYSVGIKEIDEQHQQFFGLANLIIDLMVKEPSKGEVVDALENLSKYSLQHFETEEKYFDKFAYEEAPQHIQAHNGYREKISEFFARAKNEETDLKYLAFEVAAYSNAWLSTHILLIDKKYTKFFIEHGLE